MAGRGSKAKGLDAVKPPKDSLATGLTLSASKTARQGGDKSVGKAPPKAPRQKVRGSQTGRPIMVLLDVLGQRWTLRVLWELGDTRANFRVLRLKCDDVSPTLLNKRLRQLRDLGLVDLDTWGYGLTVHGKELAGQLVGLDVWANEWAKKK